MLELHLDSLALLISHRESWAHRLGGSTPDIHSKYQTEDGLVQTSSEIVDKQLIRSKEEVRVSS